MEPPRPIHALLVEDSHEDAELLVHKLRPAYSVSWRRVQSGLDLQKALSEQAWDIVFCDYTMPGFNGLDALAIVQRSGIDLPFVFISGTVGEQLAVQAMKAGASDYLMKDNLMRLLPLVSRELQEAASRRERRAAERRLFYLAHHDVLTGLPNRMLLTERIDQVIELARATGLQAATAMIDLDRFRAVNDSFGHDAGDELLQGVAERLRVEFPAPFTIACIGGNEFVLLMPELHGLEDLDTLLSRLLGIFSSPFNVQGRAVHAHASIGAALFPEHADGPLDLLRYADVAMGLAKRLGGNRYCVYSPEMAERVHHKLTIEHALRCALDTQELRMAYQAQIDLRSLRVVGAEALLRWSSAELGVQHPANFIPVAEECGLIIPAGMWVLREACLEALRWSDAGLGALKIAVNASAMQFQAGDFGADVLRVLDETGLAPERLEIEITETALMREPENALAALRAMRDRGIGVALDDFGTGYSSLGYLKRFPVTTLKIDRTFIRDIPSDPDDMAIVSAIIAMAHRLKIEVLAEAVETAEQLNFLRAEGCDLVQGFLLHRPMSGPDFLATLLARDPKASAILSR